MGLTPKQLKALSLEKDKSRRGKMKANFMIQGAPVRHQPKGASKGSNGPPARQQGQRQPQKAASFRTWRQPSRTSSYRAGPYRGATSLRSSAKAISTRSLGAGRSFGPGSGLFDNLVAQSRLLKVKVGYPTFVETLRERVILRPGTAVGGNFCYGEPNYLKTTVQAFVSAVPASGVNVGVIAGVFAPRRAAFSTFLLDVGFGTAGTSPAAAALMALSNTPTVYPAFTNTIAVMPKIESLNFLDMKSSIVLAGGIRFTSRDMTCTLVLRKLTSSDATAATATGLTYITGSGWPLAANPAEDMKLIYLARGQSFAYLPRVYDASNFTLEAADVLFGGDLADFQFTPVSFWIGEAGWGANDAPSLLIETFTTLQGSVPSAINMGGGPPGNLDATAFGKKMSQTTESATTTGSHFMQTMQTVVTGAAMSAVQGAVGAFMTNGLGGAVRGAMRYGSTAAPLAIAEDAIEMLPLAIF